MFNIPILFLTYNRPQHTKKSLKSILKIKPKKIYISNDGPKNNDLDKKKVKKVRECLNNISKKIKVRKKINNFNIGCKKANSTAIDWFFSHEREGIILEDDCIASQNFFFFCQMMLKKNKNNKNIFCASGSNFQNKKITNHSYYFSKYNHCWGWATWRNKWKKNDVKIKFWPKLSKTYDWNNFHKTKTEKKYWDIIFNKVYNNRIDSWAYPWMLSVWKNKGITIIPQINLVDNIGQGIDGTHSYFSKYKKKKKREMNLKKLSHPKKIKINVDADQFVFTDHFKGHLHIWPRKGFYLLKLLLINPVKFVNRIFVN